MKNRVIQKQLLESMHPGRVTVLFGARRTGKTTLMNQIIDKTKNQNSVLSLNGEDYDVATMLSSLRTEVLKNLVDGYDMIFIDEAQNIPKIGNGLKLIVDTFPKLTVFATGSASFDLRNKIGEPLTGRSRFFNLYPFSIKEISGSYFHSLKELSEILIYGLYPQVYLETNLKEKRLTLENIKNGYLLKDILQLDNMKDSVFIINLLKLLAFQIGNDVSLNELARSLKTSVATIQRYLDILEKTFIIFPLNGYSGNLRKEITKSSRFYFWDNGIRNVIISNFKDIDKRDDMGKLWENFCISERIKMQNYNQTFSEFYFWRTYDKQEVDLLEVIDSNIHAYEFKWGNKKTKPPRGFLKNYPNAEFDVINKESYYNFLLK